ncbi:YraN family protein [Candidatus Peribacteria bacterium]|nr:YraN family protein [Candidatus Peribacteria bacterium]
MSSNSLGDTGEALAREYLEEQGLQCCTQQYHSQGGEIDLICYDATSDTYVLVEVKSRRSRRYGQLQESITRQKIARMLHAAERYFLTELERQEVPYFRIDIVFIDYSGDTPIIDWLPNIALEDESTGSSRPG